MNVEATHLEKLGTIVVELSRGKRGHSYQGPVPTTKASVGVVHERTKK